MFSHYSKNTRIFLCLFLNCIQNYTCYPPQFIGLQKFQYLTGCVKILTNNTYTVFTKGYLYEWFQMKDKNL